MTATISHTPWREGLHRRPHRTKGRTPVGIALEAEFSRWMAHEQGWSYWTRKTYLETYRHASSFVRQKYNVRLLRARREHLVDYLSCSNHPGTRNNRLCGLKALYRFAGEKGYRRSNPSSGIRRVKVPRGLPRPLSPDGPAVLLKAARNLGERTFVVVALLLYAGLRAGEARVLEWADVDFDSGFVRVMGKGSKERDVPIHPELRLVLRRWQVTGGSGGGYLFPSPMYEGRPIAISTFAKEVARAGQAAALEGVHPHRCRHSSATELLDKTGNLRVVQEFLGHATATMSILYTKIHDYKLAEAVKTMDFG